MKRIFFPHTEESQNTEFYTIADRDCNYTEYRSEEYYSKQVKFIDTVYNEVMQYEKDENPSAIILQTLRLSDSTITVAIYEIRYFEDILIVLPHTDFHRFFSKVINDYLTQLDEERIEKRHDNSQT